MAHDLIVTIEDIERHRTALGIFQKVVKHCAIGRIFTGGLIGRQRRIGVRVPPYA